MASSGGQDKNNPQTVDTLYDNIFKGEVTNAKVRLESLHSLFRMGVEDETLWRIFLHDKNEKIALTAARYLHERGHSYPSLVNRFNDDHGNFEDAPIFFYKGKAYLTAGDS